MTVATRPVGDRIVLSPRENLVSGGPAEEFEHRLQELFKAGYRHVVADLRGVMAIDSAGVRALVRGLTTAQRFGGSFSLVAPNDRVRAMLAAIRLDTVLPIFDGVESAVARWPWLTSVAMRYRAGIAHTVSLDDLSEELLAGGTAGIKSVSWEHPKRFE